MLGDFLCDSPVYQEVLEERLEKGIEKGREEGLAKGREEAIQQQRSALFNITLDRFPELVRQVNKAATTVDGPAILLQLIVKISTAQTSEEVKYLLLLLTEEMDGPEN